MIFPLRETVFVVLGLLGVALCADDSFADVFTNVPEASEYTLLYELGIPVAADYEFAAPAYSVNQSGTVGFYDRVAYYLELDTGAGLEYVYASLDAITTDATRVGVPTVASGAVFQQTVQNMNVVSNVPSIVTGTGIATGNIEFWPSNYATNNSAGVPAASSASYDFGDQPATGNYGSMQIHNHGAGQTLFAFNHWGGFDGNSPSDLGIGNRGSGDPDWTFAGNSGAYNVRNLQVLVREVPPPPLLLAEPTGHLVVQRDQQNIGSVRVAGTYHTEVSQIEARAVPMAGFSGTPTDWQVIDATPQGGSFSAQLPVAAGWYEIEVRGVNEGVPVGQVSVPQIGVGEVFVTAGQSNSANWGAPSLVPTDPRVSAYGPAGWQFGSDPQPIADGSNGGTPWPPLGDAVAAEWDVPVGFISVGVGGTSVDQWQPAGSLYPRLRDVLQMLGPDGLRSVLWHQGESDYLNGTSTADYADRLQNIIAQSRADAGFDVPWGIALASFVPGLPNPGQTVIDGQLQVIDADPLAYVGAATDDLVGPAYRLPDLIHFNEAGLREHASRWAESIFAYFGDPGQTADFDADGDVDGDDYLAWQAGFGIPNNASRSQGDADSDGDVDGDDFLAWQSQFAAATGSGSSRPVPEPTGCLAALILMLAAWTRRI